MNVIRTLCFALLLSAASGAFAQTRDLSTSGELLDRIAAVVNDGVVLQSQLDEQMMEITARLREQNTQLPPTSVLRKQVLERLVMEEVQMQRADKLGLHISDEMLNGALDNIAKQNGISFADLPRAMESQGID